MKRILTLILALIAPLSIQADICEFVFRPSSSIERAFDLKSIDRINRLEGWSKRLRAVAYKSDPLAPSAERKAQEVFTKVEKGLLAGNSSDAVNAYKLLFRKVEGGSLIIERYEELAQALRKLQGSADIESKLIQAGVAQTLAKEYGQLVASRDLSQASKKVQRILRKRYRKLGRDFASYNHAQKGLARLESSKYCAGQCQQAIKEARSNIGLQADGAMFQGLKGNRNSYLPEEIRNIFNSHPSSVLAARKKEFLQEGFAVLKKYAKKFKVLRRVFQSLGNSRFGKNKRVIRVFKGVFDARYFEIDEIGIKRVSKSKFSLAKKLALAQEQSADIDQNLFFMNFSRSTDGDAQKAWSEIKKAAFERDENLFKQMLDAEELGKRLGPPSDRKLSKVFQILAAVGTAGAGWAYFNYDMKEDEVDPSGSEGDNVIHELDQIDLESLEQTDESDDETEVFIEYLSEKDSQVTDTLGVILELERELGKDSSASTQD